MTTTAGANSDPASSDPNPPLNGHSPRGSALPSASRLEWCLDRGAVGKSTHRRVARSPRRTEPAPRDRHLLLALDPLSRTRREIVTSTAPREWVALPLLSGRGRFKLRGWCPLPISWLSPSPRSFSS
jgi:hypothetical protein